MPLNTAMPIERRAAAPAPVARTSGSTPRMKANEVMRIGPEPQPRRLDRRLDDRLALGPLLAGVFDDQDRVLAAERDEQDEADLGVEVVGGAACDDRAPATVPSSASGTARITASGRIQLSYCPASTR